jgi:hypothetical protein
MTDSKTGLYKRPPCDNGNCGKREIIFKGAGTLECFGQWLFSKAHKGFVCAAHYSRAYDSMFLLNYCLSNGIVPNATYQGAKILSMKVQNGLNIRIIDSYSFLPVKLKNLPKAMELDDQCQKGDFPHYFNTMENFYCIMSSYPPAECYGVDHKSPQDRQEFFEWYNQVKNSEFDMQEQLLKYCRTDVNILRQSLMKFRSLILTHTAIDGEEGIDILAFNTIAAGAMGIVRQLTLNELHDVELSDGRKGRAVLKRHHWTFEDGESLQEHEIKSSKFVSSPIPQIPVHGYAKHHNDSDIATLWLEWQAQSNNWQIRHARNGSDGEFTIPGSNIRVDGKVMSQNICLEFFGCRWHGCSFMCFNPSLKDPKSGFTMEMLYQQTLKRIREIEKFGYKVVYVFECEFRKQLKTDIKLQEFAATLILPAKPLKIRDALAGGRTETFTLLYQSDGSDHVLYKDICSLYPSTNFECPFPACHPQIIRNQTDMDYSLQSYFGLVKCIVNPPRGLYIPVLPYRSNGKLKFPLCGHCADTESTDTCICDASQRQLTGTWTTMELKRALSVDYSIEHIHEIYHFPKRVQGKGGYFHDYIQMFLKIKQTNSGWPEGCESPEQQEKYINDYYENQGIMLDKNDIKKNQALRSISKFFLNAIWGKFGQRNMTSSVKFITTIDQYHTIVNDVTKNITNIHLVNDEVIAFETETDDMFLPENAFQNEAIAVFTTSFARLKLYDIISKADRNCLYADTDSILQRKKNFEVDILPTGPFLGQLTNELPTGRVITEFVSSGPKCYSYRLDNNDTEMKLKGITLNFVNSQRINIDLMKDIILDKMIEITFPKFKQISRDKCRGIIFNRTVSKCYKKVFTKRVIQSDFSSLPYGY